MEKTHDEITRKERTGWKQTAEDDNWRNENALGKLRDYLNELLGEDSSDKEAARQALGINLKQWAEQIDSKADSEEFQSAIQNKVDRSELEGKTQALEAEIAKRGTPVGSIDYFAMATPPAGYLKADGSQVGRETYPDLFAAIGTTFGEGDGEMTFNLPDLRGEFIRGWDDERFVDANREFGSSQNFAIENILGSLGSEDKNAGYQVFGESVQSIMDESGALSGKYFPRASVADVPNMTVPTLTRIEFDASKSVQTADETRPRNIALLPCIKAFDAAANPGLIDITGLANEVDGKLDKVIDSKPVRYVIDAYNDGTNWYRKWSDGWVEQGGSYQTSNDTNITVTLSCPFSDTSYYISLLQGSTGAGNKDSDINVGWKWFSTWEKTTTSFGMRLAKININYWYACGQRA